MVPPNIVIRVILIYKRFKNNGIVRKIVMMHAIILVVSVYIGNVSVFNGFVKRASIHDNKSIPYKKGDHLNEEICKISNRCNEGLWGKIY